MPEANEVKAMYSSVPEAYKDRQLFVHNLGELLKQTREQVTGCKLNSYEEVTITFKGGATRKVNVNMDSYLAIIRDVAKVVD